MPPKIALIAAMAENRIIGRDNDMPWHIPADFKHFKATTLGKPCIMGRKTFESIVARNGKPLPRRTNIVVSRSGFTADGATVCGTIESAIEKAAAENPSEIMVIGGAQIYELALPLAGRIYLTLVHRVVEGDAVFPVLGGEWKEISSDRHDGDPAFTFKVLEKKV